MHISRRADARHGHFVRLGASYRVQHVTTQLRLKPFSISAPWSLTQPVYRARASATLGLERLRAKRQDKKKTI